MDRPRRLALAITTVFALGASLLAPAALARELVDPTSLIPPLKAFRVCYELGPTISCDTSGDVPYGPQEVGDFGCGTIYEFGEDVSNSTRWYDTETRLIVRRFIDEHSRGYWSLSPDGAGPIVEWARDFSWDEHFAIPGDITSTDRVVKGTTLRVPALGSDLHESGWFDEGTESGHGHFANDDANIALLCPLLVG